MKSEIINLLETITGDAAFTGFGEVLQEKVYETIEKLRAINFESLIIIMDDEEIQSHGWRRRIKRGGSVKELLDIWDIDTDDCAVAQVLTHLRQLLS
jgi:hypothetical protein